MKPPLHKVVLRVAGMRLSIPKLTPEQHLDLAVSAIEMGIDQRNDPEYAGLDGTLFAYAENASDTALEMGGNPADIDAINKLWNIEAEKRGITYDDDTGKYVDAEGRYPMNEDD